VGGDRVVIARAAELPGDRANVIRIVVGAPALFPAAPLFSVDVRAIVRLDAGGVFQHDGGQVGGRLRGVDGAGEPPFRQRRERPGMINVRVRQQNGVH
jgi:hypothetical protein